LNVAANTDSYLVGFKTDRDGIVANKKYVVKLSAEERERLSALVSKGKAAAKTILKARILLKADQSEVGEGWSDERICEALDTNLSMMTRVRVKLVEAGLDAVLTRKKRSTPPIAPIFRRRGAGAADRAGVLRAAGRPRALDHPPAGERRGGARDRRSRALQYGRPGAKKTRSSRT
jgi:hypothetical protein